MPTPTTVQARFQVRADTAANWTSANPTLLLNEIGIETDTKKLKMGDGTTAWASLAYFPSIVSGGTVLGNLEIGTTGTLTFEGSTADGFETTLAVVDPTADRTITLPDATGTVILNSGGQTIQFGAGAEGTPSITTVGDLNTGIWFPAADTTAISTGGSERFRITSTGNVAVSQYGAATAKLHIRGDNSDTIADLLRIEQLNAAGTDSARLIISADAANNLVNYVSTGTNAGVHVFFSSSAERFRIGATGTATISAAASNAPFIANIGASEVARIDSLGRLLVGTSTAESIGGNDAALLQISSSNGIASIRRFNAASTGPILRFGKSRAATLDNTIVQSGDVLGQLAFAGADGTDVNSVAATIMAEVDGTPGADDMPGRLVFSTTADGASSPTERLRIDSSGRLGIGTSSPSDILTVKQTVNGDNQITIYNDDTTAGSAAQTNSISFDFARTGSSGVQRSAAIILAGKEQEWDSTSASQDGYLAFYTTINASSTTEKLRITSAGNVGIGTTSPGGTLDIKAAASTAPLIVQGLSSEFARIDSSGRLLIGTSTANDVRAGVTAITPQQQLAGTAQSTSTFSIACASTTDASAGWLWFAKYASSTIGTNTTAVNDNERLGSITFSGSDGANQTQAALIRCEVDGTPGADDMPGRLMFSTTADGATTPTEQLRITNDGVRGYNQAAPVAVDATATLTVANLKNGIITSTTAAAVTGTLPTGTLTEGGFSGLYTNFTFEWTVINTGATNNFTVAAGTNHTVVGNMVVAAGNSGRFATRRTGANTFVTYRLSS